MVPMVADLLGATIAENCEKNTFFVICKVKGYWVIEKESSDTKQVEKCSKISNLLKMYDQYILLCRWQIKFDVFCTERNFHFLNPLTSVAYLHIKNESISSTFYPIDNFPPDH